MIAQYELAQKDLATSDKKCDKLRTALTETREKVKSLEEEIETVRDQFAKKSFESNE
jgi:hypothetical protein